VRQNPHGSFQGDAFAHINSILISNGFYAATKRKAQADKGGYEPTLTAATKNPSDRVEIRIRDNGTGIPQRSEKSCSIHSSRRSLPMKGPG